MPNYDGSTRILSKIDLDDKDAQRRLQALTKSVDSLEKSLTKKTTSRNIISERLRMATEEAKRTKDALDQLSDYRAAEEGVNKALAEVQKYGKALDAIRIKSDELDAKRSKLSESPANELERLTLDRAIAKAGEESEILEGKLAAAEDKLEAATETANRMKAALNIGEGEGILDATKRLTTEMNAAQKTATEMATKEKTLTQEIEAQREVISQQRAEIEQINADLAQEAAAAGTAELEARVLEALDRLKMAAFEAPMEAVDGADEATGEIISDVEEVEEKVGEAAEAEKENIREVGDEGEKTSEKVSNALNKSLKMIVRYGLGMRSLFVLFRRLRSALIDGIKQFANVDAETAASINGLKASLAGLKGSFAAAFAPIVNAIIPWLQKLISWVTAAANALSMFFALLGGKSSYKRAVTGLNSVAKAATNAGAAAEKAKKQFSGLDEMNIWQSDSSGGGGGGGGGGGSAGDLTWEDVEIDQDSVPAFVKSLAVSFKDILLTWEDLTEEQAAEKVLAGILGLFGGIIGFAMDGTVKGGITGAITGVALSVLMSSVIFDHDEEGELDKDEIMREVAGIAIILSAGVLGWLTAGPTGALIGASIGAALFVVLSLKFGENGVMTADQALKTICGSLFTLVGGALSFAVSGGKIVPTLVGGIVGLALGIGVSAELTPEDFEGSVGDVIKKIKDKLLAKVKENGGGFQGVATTILGYIGQGFATIGTWVDTTIITPIAEKLGLGKAWEKIKSVGGTILSNIVEGLTNLPSWVSTNIITPIKNGLTQENAWDGLKDAGKTIKDNLKQGLVDLSVWAVENIVNPIGQAITGDENWKLDSQAVADVVQKALSFDVWAWVKGKVIDPLVKELEGYNWAGVWDSILSGLGDAIAVAIVNALKSIPVVGDLIEGFEAPGGYVTDPHTGKLISTNIAKELYPEYYDPNYEPEPLVPGEDFEIIWEDNTGLIRPVFDEDGNITGYTLEEGVTPEVPMKATITAVEYGSEQIREKLSKSDMTANLSKAEYASEEVREKLSKINTTANITKKKYADDKVKTDLENTNMTASLAKAKYATEEIKTLLKNTNMTAHVTKAKYGNDTAKYNLKNTNMTAHITKATDGLTEGQKTLYKSTAYVQTFTDHIPWWEKIIYNFKAALSSTTKAATGGVFANGMWHKIQSYASGGYVGGQLFLAREAGPELVGTLKGHTAVMNNDQIVASVASGVARAIAGIRFQMSGWPSVTPDMVPAIALGEVVPPKLLEIKEDLDGIRATLDRIAAQLNNGGGGNTYNVTGQVNGRALFDIILEEGRNRQAMTGRNPFNFA